MIFRYISTIIVEEYVMGSIYVELENLFITYHLKVRTNMYMDAKYFLAKKICSVIWQDTVF